MKSGELVVASMFMGEYSHTVDAKGRLIMPSRFREQLGEEFVVTKGLDGCLNVYDKGAWEELEKKISSLPLTDPAARKFSRFLLSGAVLCETDRQGRILLPANLRTYAGIEKDAVLAGTGSRVEIWSSERWAEQQELEDNVEDFAAGLSGLGLGI